MNINTSVHAQYVHMEIYYITLHILQVQCVHVNVYIYTLCVYIHLHTNVHHLVLRYRKLDLKHPRPAASIAGAACNKTQFNFTWKLQNYLSV